MLNIVQAALTPRASSCSVEFIYLNFFSSSFFMGDLQGNYLEDQGPTLKVVTNK